MCPNTWYTSWHIVGTWERFAEVLKEFKRRRYGTVSSSQKVLVNRAAPEKKATGMFRDSKANQR